MTPAEAQQQNAYNEFIAEFCEVHETCQATRDEAHDTADKIVELGKEAARLCMKYGNDGDVAHDAAMELYSLVEYQSDESRYLYESAVDAEMEKEND